jgi:ribosomal protein S14
MSNIPIRSQKDYLREFEKNRKAKGICTKCNLPIMEGSSQYCVNHYNANAKRSQIQRVERKSQGLCPQCGKHQAILGKNCDVCRISLRKYTKGYRKQVLDAYGRKCACCGITEEVFLTVDHIANDGAEHRRSIGGKSNFYRSIIKEGFPDKYQILCWNCNSAKHFLGQCPHQQNKKIQQPTQDQT